MQEHSGPNRHAAKFIGDHLHATDVTDDRLTSGESWPRYGSDLVQYLAVEIEASRLSLV